VVSPEADNPGLRFHRQKQITQRPIPTRLRIAIANSVVIVMAAGGGGGWGQGERRRSLTCKSNRAADVNVLATRQLRKE
jgi:hypothetical protein